MNSKQTDNEQQNTNEELNENTQNGTETVAEEEVAEQVELQKEVTVEDKLAEAEAKLAEAEQKLLYQMAEFDNFRKRMLKEKTDLILNGGKNVLSAMLPVLDDFERATASMEKAEDVTAVKEGVDLIFQKLVKTLQGQGLKKMESTGEVFDTDVHEAIALIPAPSDDMKGKVIDTLTAGYMLNDTVLRHAKVAVGQ